MERIEPRKGMGTGTLYVLAMALTACGILGTGILQNGILGQGSVSQLLEKMQQSSAMMAAATAALLLQALESCAVPVFAFLLIEKMREGKGLPEFGTLLAVALVSEVPYDLAMYGQPVFSGSQNPALGLVVAMVVLYFWKGYSLPIRVVVFLAGLVWVNMLSIRHGTFLLVILAILWALRDKPLSRSIFGPTAGVLCSILSPFYLASPMGFLLIHFYNGEQTESGHPARLFVYPVLLLIVGLAVLLF